MIGYVRLHRWRDSKRLADAGEVVVHEVERHGCLVVSTFFEMGAEELGVKLRHYLKTS